MTATTTVNPPVTTPPTTSGAQPRELFPPVPPTEPTPYSIAQQPMTLAPLAPLGTPPQIPHPVPSTAAILSPGRSTVRSSPANSRQTAPPTRIPSDMNLSRSSPNLGVNRGSRTGTGISRKRTGSPRTVARRSASGGIHNSSNTGAADAVLPRGSVVKITGNNRTKKELLNREGLVLSAQTLGGWHEVALYDGANVRVQRNALTLLDAPSEATVAMLPPPPVDLPSVSANIAHLNITSLERYRQHHRLPLAENASRADLENAVKKHFAKTKVNEQEVIRGFLKRVKNVASSNSPHTTNKSSL